MRASKPGTDVSACCIWLRDLRCSRLGLSEREVSDVLLPPEPHGASAPGSVAGNWWSSGTQGPPPHSRQLFADEGDERVLHMLPIVRNSQLACNDTGPGDVDLQEELSRVGRRLLSLLLGGVGGGVVSTAVMVRPRETRYQLFYLYFLQVSPGQRVWRSCTADRTWF